MAKQLPPSAYAKPEFIDNRDGNTLVKSLRGYIDWISTNYVIAPKLDIATSYFNPEGFSLLVDSLAKCSGVRLLLGAEPTAPPRKTMPELGGPRGKALEEREVAIALKHYAEGMRGDRNLLEFTPQMDAAVKRLLDFLKTGKVEVRRYEKGFLHGKAFIFGLNEGVIAGSSNFTAAGLTSNLELNLAHYQPSTVGRVLTWFKELWEQSAPFDLAAIYAERYAEYPPYLIYLRALWERYKDELNQEKEPDSPIRLTTFQNDGVFRSQRILDKYNGVMIADGVGLGKSFIAGELVRLWQHHRKKVLLIAPAALRDGSWARFMSNHQLFIECKSYEEMAAGKFDHKLQEYDLIVIDEAHALRNPGTDRAKALLQVLQGDPPKKLVLLTATPVNNSLWDLYYLLGYFIKQDAAFADAGIPSLKKKFQYASSLDPEDLHPDVLFDLLDKVVVRRTRHFVKKYYPNETVIGRDGQPIKIKFPTPHVRAWEYKFNTRPGFFEEFKAKFMPDDGDPELSLARYSPSAYRKGSGGPTKQEAALVGLIRSGLLKRFESSAYAFSKTLERMVAAHDRFLDALKAGYVAAADALLALENAGSVGEEFWEEQVTKGEMESVKGYDVEKLRDAVMKDRKILESFHSQFKGLRSDEDPKLHELRDALIGIAQAAQKDGRDDKERGNNRKVLIFTYFTETAHWISKFLEEELQKDKRLVAYRGRLAVVSGNQTGDDKTVQTAIFGFAPDSTEAPASRSEDKFDILVTTDVLAEGLNLQQCRNLINYDLPWNPMRLVQRHGRIDRIGSPHDDVFIGCFMPDENLEDLLELEARIRGKVLSAAHSIGVEQEVLPGTTTSDVNFAETRKEIERLRSGDPLLFETAGEESGAHSGEEYRQELRKGLELYGSQIENLPWAAGSGFASGRANGHFFCARIADKVFFRFVHADGGKVEGDTLACLSVIECGPNTARSVPQAALSGAYGAWQAARKTIWEEWQKATDPANLQPSVRPLFTRIAKHLRENPPPTVLQNDVDQVVASVEAPWGRRIEMRLREVFEDKGLTGTDLSAALIRRVQEIGLQPYEPPKPLPPIEVNDVLLVCWLTVQK